MLPVAILAGGLATRLHPATEKIPKAIIDVAGTPFIVRQLKYLRSQRVKRVVICIGHLGEMVKDVVDNITNLELEITYSEDGPHLLGTGGALRKATSHLPETFFVLYGDSYLPTDFSAVYEAYKLGRRSALMTVLRNENKWDKSNVLFVNGRLIEYDKNSPGAQMSHIDYGLSLISSSVLEHSALGHRFDLADLYRELSLRGDLAGFEVHTRFYEIGSHRGLEETRRYFLTSENL